MADLIIFRLDKNRSIKRFCVTQPFKKDPTIIHI